MNCHQGSLCEMNQMFIKFSFARKFQHRQTGKIGKIMG